MATLHVLVIENPFEHVLPFVWTTEVQNTEFWIICHECMIDCHQSHRQEQRISPSDLADCSITVILSSEDVISNKCHSGPLTQEKTTKETFQTSGAFFFSVSANNQHLFAVSKKCIANKDNALNLSNSQNSLH